MKMNYSAEINDKKIIYSMSKCKEENNLFKGWFIYTSGRGTYISSDIIDVNEWKIMKKMFFSSMQEIARCYGENIEDLASECWNKFFNSKQPLFEF